MTKRLNVATPLTKVDAQNILEKMPPDAEMYSEGKYFKFNEHKTGVLAWSDVLGKWILWLHGKPTSFSREYLQNIE